MVQNIFISIYCSRGILKIKVVGFKFYLFIFLQIYLWIKNINFKYKQKQNYSTILNWDTDQVYKQRTKIPEASVQYTAPHPSLE